MQLKFRYEYKCSLLQNFSIFQSMAVYCPVEIWGERQTPLLATEIFLQILRKNALFESIWLN